MWPENSPKQHGARRSRGAHGDAQKRAAIVTAALCASALSAPTTARAQRYVNLPGTQPGGLAAGAPLDNASSCGVTCHYSRDPATPSAMPYDGWVGSMMGNTMRDPLFLAALTVAEQDLPGAGDFCLRCHTPPGFVGGRTRGAPAASRGANAWALRVLGTMRTEVASGEFYDPDAVPLYEAGARRAEAMLRSAVSVELRGAPRSAAPGAPLEVVARITNRIGHRVPGGYVDGRRVWLELALVRSDGQVTVISGAYDNATAHLDTTDGQLRVYEAVHGRAGMGREDHIALHDTILRDSRLVPRGYRPFPGHEPVGVDYSGGEGGALRHWDDARYTFTLPSTAHGSVTVRVRARYQSTTREYVEFLASANRTDDRGRELLRLYEASGRAAPFDMAEATAVIAVGGTTDDAGARDAGTADAGPPPPAPGCECRAARAQSAPGAGAALAIALAAVSTALGARRRSLGPR